MNAGKRARLVARYLRHLAREVEGGRWDGVTLELTYHRDENDLLWDVPSRLLGKDVRVMLTDPIAEVARSSMIRDTLRGVGRRLKAMVAR